VRLEVLAGGALAQNAMATRATLKVNLLGRFLFGSGQRRRRLLRKDAAHGTSHGRNSKNSE
jgi:hypothetical protein